MGRTEVREGLTEFEPGKALAYSLEGPAGPFAFASSRWSTRPATDRTTAVTIQGRFEAKNAAVRILIWPLIKPMLRRVTKRVLRELEAYL
jgi:ribosome-associated toxin RatA of RatAB toxin-antitoxin module